MRRHRSRGNHRAGAEHRPRRRALVIREFAAQRSWRCRRAIARRAGPGGDDDEALIPAGAGSRGAVQEPTDEECRRVYDAAPQRFTPPPAYEASHILVAPAEQSERAWADAERAALQLVAALQDGADFAVLASKVSDCPSRAEGGALGKLRPGDLARELEEVLLALKVGAAAPMPVRTKFGWHVVRLDRRSEAQVAPYESVRRFIAARCATAQALPLPRGICALAADAEIEGLTLEFGGAQ